MIVVTVELHSAVDGRVELLGKAIIGNDLTGTPTRGNYRAFFGRAHQDDLKAIYLRPQRSSTVLNYPRRALNVWYLLARALHGANYR
jgi:hypothetical protein